MSASILSVVGSLVSYVNGDVDWDATLGRVREALNAELEASRVNDARLERALDRLFDSVPLGTGIPTPIAVQTACAEVAGGDVARVVALIPACQALIARSTRFEAKRGRNGGLFRVG